MSRRLLRLLIGLYPQWWRRRYGDELQELVTEMADRGDQARARLVFGLVANAAVERIRGARWQAAAALTLVAAVCAVTALAVTRRSHPPRVQRLALITSSRHKQGQRLALITPQAQLPQGQGMPCFVGSNSACSEIPCREFVAAELVAPASGPAAGTGKRGAPRKLIARGRRQCVSDPSVHGQTFLVVNG